MSIKINLYAAESFRLTGGVGQPVPAVIAVPEVDGTELNDCAVTSGNESSAVRDAWQKLFSFYRDEIVVDKREEREPEAVER